VSVFVLFSFVLPELWSRYMQLTEAEASFRALKSELSIRPLFHQLEPRVKAHVMVAFLGYALWVTLKHLLKRRAAIVPQPSTGDSPMCSRYPQ
jgi:transposase